MADQIDALAQLFRQTAAAHHEAFRATDGDDPVWPQWYAGYLYDRMPVSLGKMLTKESLAQELIRLDQEVKSKPEVKDWAAYYAGALLSKID